MSHNIDRIIIRSNNHQLEMSLNGDEWCVAVDGVVFTSDGRDTFDMLLDGFAKLSNSEDVSLKRRGMQAEGAILAIPVILKELDKC